MSTRGGRRQGAGRKRGSVNAMSMEARERAAKSGELPHELLLRISRGEMVDGETPSLDKRVDAAKAAAPYYAARLATTTLQGPSGGPVQLDTLGRLSKEELKAELASKLRQPAMRPLLEQAGLKVADEV